MSEVKNVLVVGGAGYIGSHTTLALKDAGFNPVVYDNFSTGHRDACFGDHLVEGDLADTAKLCHTLKEFNINCVVHFAALIEAGQSVIEPLPYFENNVAGTLSLLSAMNKVGVKNIVFSSTAAVYGNRTDVNTLAEDLPRSPINPYGDSKAMVEKVLETCVSAYGINAIALRYFNACGADAQGRTGERHTPETHLIPLIIETALGQRSQISIYGEDYDTPDGTCIRDYIHVSDLATGHVAAVKNLLASTNQEFKAINLGTGSGMSVKEVIQAVKQVSGRDFTVAKASRRTGDPSQLIADAQKAQEELGWVAKHSSINEIVKDAWSYALSQQN